MFFRSPAPLPAPSQRLRRDPLGHAGRAPGKVESVTRLAGPAGDPELKAPPAPRSSSPMATRRRARRRASDDFLDFRNDSHKLLHRRSLTNFLEECKYQKLSLAGMLLR